MTYGAAEPPGVPSQSMLGPNYLYLYPMKLNYEFQLGGQRTGGVLAAQVAPKGHFLGIYLSKRT